MKTLLIVEDEKMIRQGIKAMVQRSGVPVEVIIECNNGEMALEVIKEQKIDVMFTDIRMPKMDGIELVKRMQSCEHIPLTVAISGYDDFSYAVEMLRNGVKEYILKPIEREKIVAILHKLNEELESKKEEVATTKKMGVQQMKHMLLRDDISEEELKTIEKQYGEQFYKDAYRICCQRKRVRETQVEENQHYLFLELGEHHLFIVQEVFCDYLLKNELKEGYVGISSPHYGIRELKQAFQEAMQMRQKAFLKNRFLCSYEEDAKEEHVPEKLLQEAKKQISAAANLQRVQLLGTDRRSDFWNSLYKLFFETQTGRITVAEFEACMHGLFADLEQTYRHVVPAVREELRDCDVIWNVDCMEQYEEKVKAFFSHLHACILEQADLNKNAQKMKQAVEYIEENYAKDLNMAVVSNYISMNYSLFSYSFKQYTGSNFVIYLKEIRMKKAKELLQNTDLKIVEISQAVGYDNEKHFMKLFKATCGVSPSEYRKNMQVE